MRRVKRVRLRDGTRVFCIARPEARALDGHTDGYFRHGIDVRAGDVVFDVGANIGLFGVRVAQRTGARATVYSFEPVPPIRAVLEANARRLGGGSIRALPWALADAPGELAIAFYPRSPGLSTGHPEIWDASGDRLTDTVLGGAGAMLPMARLGRMIPRFAGRWIARYLRGREQRFVCRVRTVGEVRRELGVERIDLLKVDVEGAELDVLRGLDADEWQRVGSVVVEVHDLDGRLATVRALLAQHGFGRIAVEAEAGFEHTVLRNVYATRG